MSEERTCFCDQCGKYLFTGTMNKKGRCIPGEGEGYLNADYKEVGENRYLCRDCFDIELFVDYEDDEVKEWVSGVRRPYYRLIGKPVTEEQALEIIARTDRFWSCCADDKLFAKIRNHFIYTYTPMNAYWFYNLFPTQNGFVKPNGNIYSDGITDKYPTVEELLEDFVNLAGAFPYLDFVMAVTLWEEVPDKAWERISASERVPYRPWEVPEFWENFDNVIDIVFKVCNGRVSVLSEKTGREIYKEYEEKYLDKNDMTFYDGYADEHQMLVCDEEYMRKMFAYYNLEGEEIEKYLRRTKEFYEKRYSRDRDW